MINKSYIFEITHLGNTRQVFPINNDFVLEYEREDGEVFYRKKLSTEFLFCKDDFEYLYEIEQSCDRCLLIDFKIQKKCNGAYEPFFNGRLNLNEGNWNPAKCEVAITPQSIDEYSCFLENWKEEKNILAGLTRVTTNLFIGVIECQTCTSSTPQGNFSISGIPTAVCNPAINSNEGWTVTEIEIDELTQLSPLAYETNIGSVVKTKYCREFLASTTMPPGLGWVAVTGGYARALDTTNENITFDSTSKILKQSFDIAGYDDATQTTLEIDNGLRLQAVLDLWLSQCGLTIVSDFFGINSDNTAPNNQAYVFGLNSFQDLLIFQKTDIKNVLAFQNASQAKITLEALLSDLKVIFNLAWKIENNIFRLEHISFFSSIQGLDLTTISDRFIKGKTNYTYRQENLPQYERFEWMDDVSVYFEGNDIRYTGACINVGEVKEYQIRNITTDLAYALTYPDEIDNKGLFLISALLYQGAYYLDDNNKSLSWREIHSNLYLWNRPQLNGFINNIPTQFESAIRLKQQEELEVPLCCEDMQAFDPSDLIKTQYGWGEIEKASFSTKSSCMKLEILHNQNCEA